MARLSTARSTTATRSSSAATSTQPRITRRISAALIDTEIKRIITEAYARAKKLLEENIDKLHFVAGYLFKNEIMDGEQFAAAMDGAPTVEELEAMVAEKKRKSDEENAARAQRNAEEARRREEEEQKRLEAERRRFDPTSGDDSDSNKTE